ncbi:unnamed protein product [Rodentolepis nana]|uniref:BRCT domain-containing protein n=1 Tax=Rodentolepis nana TaxID=102285 RepID=A0A0R3TNN4_RODNA|nr:unnamed protein product [Rodentolepis nana]
MKLTDLSRFGTFLNKSRLTTNASTEIPPNSEVTFGAQPGFTVLMKFTPLNILLSAVLPRIKLELQPIICSLGGKILPEWTQECNLLVMSKLIVTHKVLCCLLRGVNVVTPKYLNALKNLHSNESFSFPDPSMYLPPIEEKGFTVEDSPKFKANPNRRHIFTGKTFIFLLETKVVPFSSNMVLLRVLIKFQRFNLLLNLSNAKSICVPEKLSLSRTYFIDLFGSTPDPCLVYESGNVNSGHELAYSVLKENFNRRPILDQEISLAIIDSSCAVYCNATCPCPVGSDRRFLNTSFEYSSWNLESVISRRDSSLKRPREQSTDQNRETDLLESVPKRQCRRTPILPPSTRSTKPTKKPSHILVPDTEQANIQTNNSTNRNSSIKEELAKEVKQPSPRTSFESTVFPSAPNQNRNTSSDCHEESNEDDQILDAFDSIPPFVSTLKKKEATLQVEKSTTKSVSRRIHKNLNADYGTDRNINANFDVDEVFEDDPVLNAFDSMPSFSSMLKKNKIFHQVDEVPKISVGAPASGELIEKNSETMESCNEISALSPKINKSPLLPKYPREFSSNDKENIRAGRKNILQPLLNPPISADGFLSKEVGQKLAGRTGVSKESNSADKEETATVSIKFCPLINNAPFSSDCPNRPRNFSHSSSVNFKRFIKVWTGTTAFALISLQYIRDAK